MVPEQTLLRVWAARIAAAILLGVFLALGHDSTLLGWAHGLFALVLIVVLMPLDRAAATARFGWCVGLGYFGWTLRWIVEPFLVDVARHGWMAPFAIALMAGGLALFWGGAFWAARALGGRDAAKLWLPVTFTAAELLRGHIFTGFPWGLLSYTLIGGPADVWLAFVGSYGTVFLMVGFASSVVVCLVGRWRLGGAGLAALVLATGLVAALAPPAPAPTDQTVRVVQPNAPQHQKWDPEWMPVFFDRAVGLTGGDGPVDAVIWPETSVPTLLEFGTPWFEQMVRAAAGAPVVAGMQRRDSNDVYNTLVVIEDPQSVDQFYDKAHLVPFGEYIPLAHLLEPLGFGTLVDQVAGFTPGSGDGVLDIDGLGRARVLICYEGIFPEEIQRGGARADVMLIITNDAWFGTGPGPRQHLVQAQARAIEQGLPVIRSANTGISAVIDARGRIKAWLPLGQAGALDAAVPAALPPTVYARIGDWPLVMLICLLLGGGVFARRFGIDAVRPQG